MGTGKSNISNQKFGPKLLPLYRKVYSSNIPTSTRPEGMSIARAGTDRRAPRSTNEGPDIMNDAKLSRTILKDLGIIQERERKVEVIGNLKMLWERESDDRQDDAAVIDAEAKRVD